MTTYNAPAHDTKAHYSLPSLIAIGCAIASFFVGAGLGILLAIIAVIAGIIGLLLSFAPSVRGGMVSFFSVFAGVVGIIAAIVRFFF